MEKIRSGSLFEVAEVFRDLYRLKVMKPLSFGERRMLDTARGLIVQELSVAQSEDEARVEEQLESAAGVARPAPGPDPRARGRKISFRGGW